MQLDEIEVIDMESFLSGFLSLSLSPPSSPTLEAGRLRRCCALIIALLLSLRLSSVSA